MKPRPKSAPNSFSSKSLHLELLEPRCVLSGLGLPLAPLASTIFATDSSHLASATDVAGTAFVSTLVPSAAAAAATAVPPVVSTVASAASTTLDLGASSLGGLLGGGVSSLGSLDATAVPASPPVAAPSLESLLAPIAQDALGGNLLAAAVEPVATSVVDAAALPQLGGQQLSLPILGGDPLGGPTDLGGVQTLVSDATAGLSGAVSGLLAQGVPSSVLGSDPLASLPQLASLPALGGLTGAVSSTLDALSGLGGSAGLASLDLAVDVAGLLQVDAGTSLLGSTGLLGLDLSANVAGLVQLGTNAAVGGAQGLLGLGVDADLLGAVQLQTGADLLGSTGLASVDLGVQALDLVQLDTAASLGGAAGLVGLNAAADVAGLAQVDLGTAVAGAGGLLGVDLGVQALGVVDVAADVGVAGTGGLVALGVSADVAGTQVSVQTNVGGPGGLVGVQVDLPLLGTTVSVDVPGVGPVGGGGAPLGTDQTIPPAASPFDDGAAGLLVGANVFDAFSLGDEAAAAADANAGLLVGEEEELFAGGDLETIVSAEAEEAAGTGEAFFSMWEVDAGGVAARVAPMLLAPNLGGAAAAMFLAELNQLAVGAAGSELASLQAALEGFLEDLDALGASLSTAAAPLVPWLAAAALAAGAAIEIVRREQKRRKSIHSEALWALGGV